MKPEQPQVATAPAPAARKRSPSSAVRERLKLVELLLEVSRQMAGHDSLDGVLEALVEMTTDALGAERGSLFLNDEQTSELYSRVAQGNNQREIRLLNTSGIAGHVFTTGESVSIADPYADPRFNRAVDEQTGFVTRNILCAPIRTVKGDIIGVAQSLNKINGDLNEHDLRVLEAMTTQGTLALQSAVFISTDERADCVTTILKNIGHLEWQCSKKRSM